MLFVSRVIPHKLKSDGLRQVLFNILENGSKYIPNGGGVVLSVEELEQEEGTLGIYRFIIEDNGIGMKPDYLAHIFEPFSRSDDSRLTKITGTGLGMTIVHNIVTMMGGDIQVESTYGQGSRFVVTLCLTKREAAEPEKKTAAVFAADLTGMRVLLVEDNAINQQIAAEMLKLFGVEAEIADNGQQAVLMI